jgi:glycosyltransferase involved in cell wall biosynthesis
LLGFKIIVQHVELRSYGADRNTLFKRLNDKLFDNNFHLFCDGAIAITDFLTRRVTAKDSNLPVIKIPAMCDFSEFNLIQPYLGKSYLMYCGTISYYKIIEFVIDIFSSLKSSKAYDGELILVISGNHDRNWKKIMTKINDDIFGKYIIVKSNIPYPELLSLYKGAEILMIPLRNTIQDLARFPHKISEYTASGRPIISTNLGEVKIYFKDGISAVLSNEYSLSSYVNKLTEMLPKKTNLDSIGLCGYEIGRASFDYQAQTLQLKNFILNL